MCTTCTLVGAWRAPLLHCIVVARLKTFSSSSPIWNVSHWNGRVAGCSSVRLTNPLSPQENSANLWTRCSSGTNNLTTSHITFGRIPTYILFTYYYFPWQVWYLARSRRAWRRTKALQLGKWFDSSALHAKNTIRVWLLQKGILWWTWARGCNWGQE